MDSGATSHMCNNRSMFTELNQPGLSEKVTLGDGSALDVTGVGTVAMDMLLNYGSRRGCALKKVLYVPELAYNLVSVLRAAEAGKSVYFDDSGCEFLNEASEKVAWCPAGKSVLPEVCQEVSGGRVRSSNREQGETLAPPFRTPERAEHAEACEEGARRPARLQGIWRNWSL